MLALHWGGERDGDAPLEPGFEEEAIWMYGSHGSTPRCPLLPKLSLGWALGTAQMSHICRPPWVCRASRNTELLKPYTCDMFGPELRLSESKSSLGKNGFIWCTGSQHSRSLREARSGTQSSRRWGRDYGDKLLTSSLSLAFLATYPAQAQLLGMAPPTVG